MGLAPAPTPGAAALCRRLGAGSRQGRSSAAKAGVGWTQPGGLRQLSAGRAWGEQGTHSKGQEEGGSITHPHRLLPWPRRTPGRAWLSVLSPPSPPPPNLHTYIGVLGGPQPGWGGMLRDWTAQSHAYRLSLEMGRGKALQAALCVARQLADCLRQGGSCQLSRAGGHVPCRATKGKSLPCPARASTRPRQRVHGGTWDEAGLWGAVSSGSGQWGSWHSWLVGPRAMGSHIWMGQQGSLPSAAGPASVGSPRHAAPLSCSRLAPACAAAEKGMLAHPLLPQHCQGGVCSSPFPTQLMQGTGASWPLGASGGCARESLPLTSSLASHCLVPYSLTALQV